jgi:hypothetical protein
MRRTEADRFFFYSSFRNLLPVGYPAFLPEYGSHRTSWLRALMTATWTLLFIYD